MATKKRLQYRYSSVGQRSLLVDMDGGRFTCTYDSVKRLTQVQNPQGQRTSYSYDNAGRRKLKKLANGSRTSYTYDAAGQMTTVAHLKSDGSQQARFDYTYDDVGNRTRMVELDGSRVTWTYDSLDQLTGEHRTGTNGYRHTYTYDTRGNRLLKNLDGVRTTSSYDDANQLRWTQDAAGRTTYTFDADGNQQVVLTPAGQRTTSVWDYENKLTGVLNPSGTRETMAYDPDGKRVKHQTTSDTVKYVWDDQNYLAETNASDVTQAVYTNEPKTYGNLISQRKAGTSHYYLFDALGSTRLLTDSAEAVSESLLYDAWGNLVTAAPTLAVPFRWVGELGYLFVPSTSDYYVRARVYQPSIGRWVSKDPIEFLDGVNLFSFLFSPINDRDPSGSLRQAVGESGCQYGRCVTFRLHTVWELGSEEVGPGIIVQAVSRKKYTVLTCDNQEATPNPAPEGCINTGECSSGDYLEIWHVNPDGSFADATPNGDHFSNQGATVPNTKGEVEQLGEAYFIPTDEIPAGFVERFQTGAQGIGFACALPSVCLNQMDAELVRLWQRAQRGRRAARKQLIKNWNCCPCEERDPSFEAEIANDEVDCMEETP